MTFSTECEAALGVETRAALGVETRAALGLQDACRTRVTGRVPH